MSLNSQYFGSSSCLSLASLPLPDSAERNVDIRGKSVRIWTQKKRKLEGLSKQRLAVCMIKWFLYQSVGMSARSLLSFQTMALCQGGCSQSMSIWLFFCPLFFCMLQCCFFLPSTSFQLRSCPFTIFWTSLYFCTLDFPFPLVKLRKRGHVPCLSHGPRPRPTRYEHIL